VKRKRDPRRALRQRQMRDRLAFAALVITGQMLHGVTQLVEKVAQVLRTKLEDEP